MKNYFLKRLLNLFSLAARSFIKFFSRHLRVFAFARTVIVTLFISFLLKSCADLHIPPGQDSSTGKLSGVNAWLYHPFYQLMTKPDPTVMSWDITEQELRKIETAILLFYLMFFCLLIIICIVVVKEEFRRECVWLRIDRNKVFHSYSITNKKSVLININY